MPIKNIKNLKCRAYVLTSWSKQTKEDYEKIFYNNTELIRYWVFQKETGDNTKGRHWQLYIELKKPTRVKKLKEVLKDDTLHVEQRLGRREQARFYCMKNYVGIYDDEYKWTIESCGKLHRGRNWNDCYYEFGDWTKGGKGSRNDIKNAHTELDDGCSLETMAINNPVAFIKYHRGFREYKNILMKANTKKFRKVSVKVYWGVAGSGKSKKALYDDENNRKDDIYVLEQSANGVWFDGYDGEKTLVINDFYGWIKYGMFLNLLDGHQQRLEIKGGSCWANWNEVILTSNKHPSGWYSQGFTLAMKRRISDISEFQLSSANGGTAGTRLSGSTINLVSQKIYADNDELDTSDEETGTSDWTKEHWLKCYNS